MKREKESWGCRIVTGIHMGVSSVMFTDASFVGASGTRFRIDERGARRRGKGKGFWLQGPSAAREGGRAPCRGASPIRLREKGGIKVPRVLCYVESRTRDRQANFVWQSTRWAIGYLEWL